MSQMGPKGVFPILFAANGTSAEFFYNGSKGALQISGVFGTDGVLTCEVSLNDADFAVDPGFGANLGTAGSVLTAGIVYFSRNAPLGAKYRLVLADATTTPALQIDSAQGEAR